MRKVTEAEVVALLNKAVADYGADWIDPNSVTSIVSTGCSNTYEHEGGTRHCIAGYVFKELGVIKGTVADSNNKSAADDVIEYAATYEFDVAAADLLCEAQALQDKGHTWGDAVGAANHVAEAP